LYDEHVARIAMDISTRIPEAKTIRVSNGEQSKSLREVERITQELLRADVSRESVLVLVGGGMLTDLGAFVAGIYMRGIRFVIVPTSFLCMVDAAVGGKTGVDAGAMKNILGVFALPELIVMDTDVLKTLPDERLKEGLVEVIKMAAMLDADCFEWLEQHSEEVISRKENALTECIERAVRMKIDVVEEDEWEHGKRMFLNFGHTVGHALEAQSGFKISHGQAVSRGMVAEMAIAGTQDARRITALLAKLALPAALPDAADADALWALMGNDKKTVGRKISMAVPERIGTGKIQELEERRFRSICV